MDDWGDWILKATGWFLVVFVVIFVIAMPVAFYQDCKRPTFALKKDDWRCTNTRERTYTTIMMVGQVMVPQTHTSTDCVQWTAK